MPFAIETFDKPLHQHVRQSVRSKHLEFLAQHAQILLACGAKLNDDGSDAGGGIYIVDLDNRAAAQAFIEADPFAQAGLFERYTIVRWRQAYLGAKCFL